MIRVERHDAVALLRVSHGKANALDLELCGELTEKFRSLAAASDPALHAVVITGQGSIFSFTLPVQKMN